MTKDRVIQIEGGRYTHSEGVTTYVHTIEEVDGVKYSRVYFLVSSMDLSKDPDKTEAEG